MAKTLAGYRPPPIVEEIEKKLGEAMSSHAYFVKKAEQGYRAYQGVLESSSDAAKWNHQVHPPYAFNLLETIVANTIEEGLRFSCKPAPQVTGRSLEDLQKMLLQGEVCESLLRHEHRIDGMDEKQRPLYLEQAITGRGWAKSYWNLTQGSVKRQGVVDVEHYDDDENYLGTLPTITEITEDRVLRDHSTTEILDSRDVILHESAKSLQPWEPGGAQHLFHRGWYSYEQLLMQQEAGYLKNVEYLKENNRSHDGEMGDREQHLFQVNRTKDLIEVMEYWCFEKGTVYRTIIGERHVLLREKEESPFWHGGYPFLLCRSMPIPFSLNGMSEIELIRELQEILWELMNQRLDNVELINNAIMLIRSDVDDPDAFEHYPGARWQIDGDVNSSVAPLVPPYQVADVSLQSEALLKGDLQNVTSAAPFAAGTETASVDQKTATGASIVMSAAQKRLQAKKYQSQFALRDEANMRLKNCQQFISGTRVVHETGPDGLDAFREIDILTLQDEFVFELEPMGESTMREQRRAESTQITQVLLQAMPVGAAVGEPISFKEVIKAFLKDWGREDYEKYFSAKPSAAGAMAAGSPGAAGAPPGAGQAGAPEGPNMGITSDTAVDAGSPSATGGMSLSPESLMARAQSLSSGGGNA